MKKEIHESESREVVEEMADKVEQTLNAFDIPIKVVKAIDGLRQYHFYLKTLKPVRMKVIKGFEDDLRYTLGSSKLTIEAPMPDATLIGITVPKKDFIPELSWNDVVQSETFTESDDLVVPIGQDELGADHFVDIRRMPHLFIAGETGSGKSMLLNSLICSLMVKHTTDELRFIFVDPKRWGLVQYENIHHLLTPVITDTKKVLMALKWCIKEMERRLDIFQQYECQNISAYHENILKNPEYKSHDLDAIPYIVVVIDDFADLMAAYPKELEATIQRLTTMCRTVGIHLILSTQRASASVFTPLLKTNILSRITCKTSNAADSRSIIDQSGAENLLGDGDMLLVMPDMASSLRIQGYHLSQDELLLNIKAFKSETVENFKEVLNLGTNKVFSTQYVDDDEDDLYEEVKEEVLRVGKASTSQIQRKFRIGYSRAAGLMDILEERGIIGPAKGAEPRRVIWNNEE